MKRMHVNMKVSDLGDGSGQPPVMTQSACCAPAPAAALARRAPRVA